MMSIVTVQNTESIPPHSVNLPSTLAIVSGPMALTIVADDLTAACDTGTLFAGKAPEAERAVRPPGEGFSPVNDLVIQNVVVVPVLWRNGVSASSVRLRGMDLSGWDSTLWRLAYWHKAS